MRPRALDIKLLILVIAILSAGMGVLTYVNIQRHEQDLIAGVRAKTETVADSLCAGIKSIMRTGDVCRARDYVRDLRSVEGIANLKIYNATFGHQINTQLEFAGGSGGTGDWEFLNNAMINDKPAMAKDPSNMVVISAALDDHFADYSSGNYRLKLNSFLVEAGKTLSAVPTDRVGEKRTSPYDVGAYEFSTNVKPDNSPAAPKNLRLLD